MLHIINYCKGIVKIRISGMFPEKFINLCIARDIILWDIVEKEDCIYAYIRLYDFFCIRPLARQSRVNISVIFFRGLPFICKKLKSRKMLVSGAVLSLVTLYVLSSYIWFIDVCGNKNVSVHEIMVIAEKNDLRPGVVKNTFVPKKVEHALLSEKQELAWAGVSVVGTHAVIEVVEKTLPPPPDSSPVDIYAAKDGVITEIVVIFGQAVCKVGDHVKTGDLLIKNFGGNSVDNSSLRAKGIVNARVKYASSVVVKTRQEEFVRTGRKQVAFTIFLNGKPIQVNRVDSEVFSVFEKEHFSKKCFDWRKEGLTVEFKIDTYHELKSKWKYQSIEQASQVARTQAWGELQQNIPLTAKILTRNISGHSSENGENVFVEAVVETIEEIGLIKASN